MSRYFAAVGKVLAVGVLTAATGIGFAQQSYPSKPIRFIVPYAPGGSTTIVSRLIGQKLTASWGQPVIIDNRPGGSTIIGTEALLKSPPDGYAILLISSSHVLIPLLLPTPYDVIRDFAPVTTIASSESVLVVTPSLPANNLQEFIALAKAKPGQLNYASSGSGSVTQLAAELFNIMTGVKTQHVPYKGAAPAIPDLIGGQVQLYFAATTNVIPFVRNGRLKAIAISGETRSSALPQVPTFTQAGLPGFDARFWQGILAPGGTPREIVDKLATEIGRTLVMPDTKEKLDSQGFEPFISTPAQLAALMKADMARYAKIIKTANIKLEQ